MITSPLSTNVTAGAAFSYQITASNSPTSFAASGTAIPPLSINSGSGVISGNAPTIPGAYPINISAINSAGTNSAILNLTVDPVAGAPVFSSTTLNGTVGQAVTDLDLATLVTSNGPVTASSFGFQSALPAGLTQTNGLVSGTPTSAGTNSYIFYASNAAGFGTGTLTIAVQPALPFISATMPAGQVGTPVDFTFTASNSPIGYGASGLPYGLSITSNRITGTPTASGVYAVSLTATNTNGSFTNTFNWTVASYPTNLPIATSLLAGWDFQTTNTGGTVVAAAPNTPTIFAANFGSGSLYLNGAEGSSAWATNELDAATGTSSANRGSGFSSATTDGALQIYRSTANSKNLVFKVSMAGRSDLRISYAINGSSTGFKTQIWEASTNGTAWTKFAEVNPVPVPSSSTTFSNQALISVPGVDGQSNVLIRMQVAGATSTGNNKLDNIQMTAVGPFIGLSTNSLSGLISVAGSPSTVITNYSVTTLNMGSASVIATSLSPAVELGTNSAGPFGNSISLPSTGGTVHLRLSAAASVGALTGALVRHTGDSAIADLTVAGTVYARGSSNTLVGWDADDLTNATVPSNWSPAVANSGITVVSGWTRETNGTVSGVSSGGGWGGTSWATNLTSAEAIGINRGAVFSIQPKAGKKVSLTSIAKLDYRRTASGPTNGLVQIQVGTNSWLDVASVSYTNAATGGDSLPPIDLSTNAAFTNIRSSQTITVRLVNFGATSGSGSWHIFDKANTPELDFELTGVVENDASNSAPTDIALSANSIAENNAVNAVIGALSSTDPDAGDTATYSLVAGSGDTDNPSFNISGTSLRASAGLDFETKSSYSIRVRAIDSANNTFEKVLTITVTDLDEVAPVITLLGSNQVTISWGGSWTDDGATATDNVDSSVTVNSSGTVNPAVPGTYTITYTASDAAGNAATPVIRTVTVSAPSNTVGADGLSGLLRYAFGANGPNDSVTRPSNSVSGGNLVLTAIVRTNNSKLSVVGEAVTNLSDYTNAPSITPVNGATNGVSQADVPAGCERQAFSVPQGADAKKFLRLKATLAP